MSHVRALAWNTGVQLIGKVISTIFGIFVVGLLTRLLGQDGFGLYTTANAYLQIFALILDLGINVTFSALLGEHAEDEAFEKRCVSALFTLRLLMAIIVLILAPLIWFLLYPKEQTLLFAIIALNASVFFPAINQILIGLAQRHLRMHIPAIGEVIGRAALLGGLLVGASQGWSLVSLLWLVSIGSFLNFLFCLTFIKPRGRIFLRWDPIFWKETLIRSWPIGISIAFNLIYFKADTFVLSRVRSLAEVGIYGAAYRVLEILITVPFMYAGILLPILSQIWGKQDRATFGNYLGRSIEVMLYLACPMVVGTWVLGPAIMRVVSGPEFVTSGEVLRVLVIAIGIIYINTVTAHAIVALNIQRQMLPVYVTVAVLTLLGYLIFIPRYGMWAAAWLTVASEAGVLLGSWTRTKRLSQFHLDPRTIMATIAASIIMGIVVWWIRDFSLFLAIGIGAVVYAVALLGLGGITIARLKQALKPASLS